MSPKFPLLLCYLSLALRSAGQETPVPTAPTMPPAPEAPGKKADSPAPPKVTEVAEVSPPVPTQPAAPLENLHLKEGSLDYILTTPDRDLFEKGKRLGHVQDNPKNSYRRLVQRTIMPSEAPPFYGPVLTFDDQIVPAAPDHASALEIAEDLQKVGARAIFFANIPGVDKYSVLKIAKRSGTFASKEKACLDLLNSKRSSLMKVTRDLLRMKNAPNALGHAQYTCEVYNHTAFHQDLLRAQASSDSFKLSLVGIDFIEKCLDEAYAAERPDWPRTRYFRFPFLHVPKNRAAQELLDAKFSELGLISLGETQDSKDVHNKSSKEAYKSLIAAQKGFRYNPKLGGNYGKAERPVALFHTKTWRDLKSGILSAIKETASKKDSHQLAQLKSRSEQKRIEAQRIEDKSQEAAALAAAAAMEAEAEQKRLATEAAKANEVTPPVAEEEAPQEEGAPEKEAASDNS